MINPASFPILFEIKYDNAQFSQGFPPLLSLSVRIENAGNLSYITDTNWSVLDDSRTKIVDSISVPVIKT